LVKTPRKELQSHLTGSATFVEDLDVDGELHIGFLRSPLAHARIREIDRSRTNQTKELVGVFTRRDLEALLLPSVWREYPLAATEVVYQGQPVAAVVTSERQSLEDCLESISVSYEPLPVVTDSVSALFDGEKWLTSASSNVVVKRESKAGRADDMMLKSAHVMSLRLNVPRISPFPLEGRGMVIERGPDETVVYSPTQAPSQLQQFLLRATGEKEPVRVIQTAVGGAFGGKIFPYAEDLACYLISSKLGRNVKWIPLPEEKLVTLTHRPNQVHDVKVGFEASGKILAFKDWALVDAGAHFEGSAGGSMEDPGTNPRHESVPIDQMVSMMTGPYDIEDVEISVTAVATNKMMMGPIRGSGGMTATFVLERVMNQIALKLGLDQFSVRRANLIRSDSKVHTTLSGAPVPQLRLADLLAKARRSKDTAGLTRAASAGRGAALRGIGVSFYLAESAPPSAETVRLELTKEGGLCLFTSVAPSGQGSERALESILRSELNPGRSPIEVRFGDTTTSSPGVGTQSSRSITYAGSAALMACPLPVGRIGELLAQRFETEPSSVVFSHGTFHVRGKQGRSLDLGFMGSAAELGEDVAVDATYSSETSTFSSGCHLSLVEVDSSTGAFRVLAHLAFDDFGTVFDSYALTAQTEGAVLQSLGEALQETIEYNAHGLLRHPYRMPSIEVTPRFYHTPVLLTTSQHLHGARGAGEAGRVGSLPAIINALENALSKTSKNGFLQSIPIDSESVLSLITTG
jgi:carbon-monoxide dehydrogenase large subunit